MKCYYLMSDGVVKRPANPDRLMQLDTPIKVKQPVG